ncbi:MAG: tetratricopeptide repeat protein [Chitinophagales bacterium]
MKNLSIVFFISMLFLISCESSSTENKVSEQDIESIIADLKTVNTLDKEKINTFITSVDNFVVSNPKSEKAPNYLELKAKYITALGKHNEAIKVYDNIYQNYENYKNYSDALFMKAFIYENNLNNKAEAELHYQKYLNEFPNGVFAKDAQFSLDNMNKTPEELMEMFKKMNEEAEKTTAQ